MGRVGMVRDLVAELVMGRVCYGPSLSWAEFVMGRDVPESVQGVRSNPRLRPNYFIFMGIYLKSWVKLTKRTPFCKFEPPFKKS